MSGGAIHSDRGFYGVGIVGSKTPINVGTLWRSAGILGAAFMFTASRRYPQQASDTIKAWKHTPFFEFDCADDLFGAIPRGCIPIAVEMGGKPLETLVHPERAVYILGAEDTGVPPRVLDRCAYTVTIPGDHSLNVAVAGSIVLYDRIAKGAVAQSVEHRSEKTECRRFDSGPSHHGGRRMSTERREGATTWLWNALGSALYPRWLYRGPYWWRSLNAWWLGWWGAAFFHTDPWRPFRGGQ